MMISPTESFNQTTQSIRIAVNESLNKIDMYKNNNFN